MSGPVASNLVLLADLPACAQGSKVRFLGCIDEYVTETATLRLKHNYPISNPPVIANLNVQHVLERIKYLDVDIGTWLNVVGYVERTKEQGVFVQAVTVWSAGNVDLKAYEKAVEARKAVA
ncbi:hypothetical protein ACET3X_009163 [Alternaria dauci]|uniref:CST complex subunit Ten1 n=1 Tax=Alternaria dauci TaxID=48095 RepID=A0ABR3U825_9PLEO